MKKHTPVEYAPCPSHLSERSRALWMELGPSAAKTTGRQILLETALTALDRADAAMRTVEADGLSAKTEKSGACHAHPLLKVERDSRQQFLRAWEMLDLDKSEDIFGRFA